MSCLLDCLSPPLVALEKMPLKDWDEAIKSRALEIASVLKKHQVQSSYDLHAKSIILSYPSTLDPAVLKIFITTLCQMPLVYDLYHVNFLVDKNPLYTQCLQIKISIEMLHQQARL